MFCGVKCQKASLVQGRCCRCRPRIQPLRTTPPSPTAAARLQSYWPFHKPHCRRNEFADLIESSEPKFASWMRRHGKQAVLKDDEVDRLERAGQAASGASRQDVMDSMYGRMEPKPRGEKSVACCRCRRASSCACTHTRSQPYACAPAALSSGESLAPA